jgi:hypothetical protein
VTLPAKHRPTMREQRAREFNSIRSSAVETSWYEGFERAESRLGKLLVTSKLDKNLGKKCGGCYGRHWHCISCEASRTPF